MAIRAEVETTLAQITLDLAVPDSDDFFLAVWTKGRHIIFFLKHDHIPTSSNGGRTKLKHHCATNRHIRFSRIHTLDKKEYSIFSAGDLVGGNAASGHLAGC